MSAPKFQLTTLKEIRVIRVIRGQRKERRSRETQLGNRREEFSENPEQQAQRDK